MKKILLIEDDRNIRETTAEILELADYEVLAAENGHAGVKLAKEKLPRLIICDIMMPDLDGYGVLRILSKHPETASIPFIFLTAKTELGDIRKGMNLGADDYITKPFEEAELLEAVETRLQRSESLKKDFTPDLEGLNQFIDEAKGLAELKNLSKERKIKFFANKETIYHEDDYANFLYFITHGKIKCTKTDAHGKSFVSDIYGEGHFIGHLALLQDGEYHETAVAIAPTKVAVIPKVDFLHLVYHNRDVSARFIKMLSGNVQEREERLLHLAYTPVRERVIEALLYMLRQSDTEEAPFRFRIARDDLANMVGTAKESLIRVLSELKQEGLLDTDGQTITIPNKSKLEQA